MFTVFGAQLEARECHIADSTGKQKLILWEQLIGQVMEDSSYCFSNLAVRDQGQFALTTTPTTTIERVNNVHVLAAIRSHLVEEQQEVLSIAEGKVGGVELNERRQCNRCQKRRQTSSL